MIQFIEKGNNTRAKLIKKLKKKVHRIVKKIMIIKGTDREDKLSDDNNLKNFASILKNLKNKLKFTKSAVLTQSFSYI